MWVNGRGNAATKKLRRLFTTGPVRVVSLSDIKSVPDDEDTLAVTGDDGYSDFGPDTRFRSCLGALLVLAWLVVLVVNVPSLRVRGDPDSALDPEVILALGDAGILASTLPDAAAVVFLLPYSCAPFSTHIASLCERWVGPRRTVFFFGGLPASLDTLRWPGMQTQPKTYIICPNDMADRVTGRHATRWSARRRVTGFSVDWDR